MYLNRRIQKVAPSATLAITAQAKAMRAQGTDVLNLAGGEPDFDTPDFIKKAAQAALDKGLTKYTPTAGHPKLREAAAGWLKSEIGVDYTSKEVIINTGAKQSLYNALQVICEPGDEVLIPSPYWVSYPEMATLAGAKPVFVETTAADGFRLNPQAVEQALTPKSRVLILNSPSNPTGAMISKENLQTLAQLAESKKLTIISDEIYSRLTYGQKHVSIASLSSTARNQTLVVNGVSKSYSMTGWRIGFCAGPEETIKAMSRLQDHATSCASSISQQAAIAALTGDQGCVETMRKTFESRRALLTSGLNKIEGLTTIEPDGAFYCFMGVEALGLTAADFAKRLLEEKHVAAIPGEGFGTDKYLRLSFSTSDEALKDGIQRIGELVGEIKG